MTNKEQLMAYLDAVINLETFVSVQTNVIEKLNDTLKKQKENQKPKQIPVLKPKYAAPYKIESFVWIGSILWVAFSGWISYMLLNNCKNISAVDTLSIMCFILLPLLIPCFYIKYKSKAVSNFNNQLKKSYQNEVAQNKANYEKQIQKYNSQVSLLQQQSKKISFIQYRLNQTKAMLKQLYSLNTIYPKYRHLEALTMIYEYLESCRCDDLTGFSGAYNMYEDESRKNAIIMLLDKNALQSSGFSFGFSSRLHLIKYDVDRLFESCKNSNLANPIENNPELNSYYDNLNAYCKKISQIYHIN